MPHYETYKCQLYSVSASERKKALESLIFLVEKKDGRIKARHCANGSKQRQWMPSEEAASPTVMTESVMLTGAIEAKERRDVATFDIPNAFSSSRQWWMTWMPKETASS